MFWFSFAGSCILCYVGNEVECMKLKFSFNNVHCTIAELGSLHHSISEIHFVSKSLHMLSCV